MRKNICFIFFYTILILAVLCITATAESEEVVYIEELGISVPIPESSTVIQRGVAADDPSLDSLDTYDQNALLYFDHEYVATFLNSYGYSYIMFDEGCISISAFPENTGLETDFRFIDDYTLELLVQGFIDANVGAGSIIKKGELYRSSQIAFIVAYIDLPDVNISSKQYMTVFNGQEIHISFAYMGEITDADEIFMRNTVEKIVFDDLGDDFASPAFEYTDQKFGTSFIVPENWVLEKQTVTDIDTTVKFVMKNSRTSIIYSCADLWGDLPPEERETVTREDYEELQADHEYMYHLLRDVLGCEEDSVCQNTYWGVEYFRGTKVFEQLGRKYESTYLIRIEDGKAHLFVLMGNQEYFDDFISLIKTVKYSSDDLDITTENETTADSEKEPESDTDGKAEEASVAFPLLTIICFGLVLVFGVLIGVVMYKHAGKENE